MIDYDGSHVIDAAGENIGTVEQTYAGADRSVQYVEVKIGSLLRKHRMVPVGDAQLKADGLHVQYDKGVILGSPDVSDVDDVLDGDVLGAVRDYYASAPTSESAELTSENDNAAEESETEQAAGVS
jgi:uncharacterized protein YrrD